MRAVDGRQHHLLGSFILLGGEPTEGGFGLDQLGHLAVRPGFHVEGRALGAAGRHVKRPNAVLSRGRDLSLTLERSACSIERSISASISSGVEGADGGAEAGMVPRPRGVLRHGERLRAPRQNPAVVVLVDVDVDVGARVRVLILFVVGTLFGTIFGTLLVRVFLLVQVVDARGARGDDAVLEVAVVGREAAARDATRRRPTARRGNT